MKLRTLALLLLVALVQPTWSLAAQQTAASGADNAALTTRLALRDLWVEHIFWVRNYVVANQDGQRKQADAAATQVVDNAKAIANSIAPLYGQPAADQLLELLAGHWSAVKHYSDAAVAKDDAGKKAAVTDLTRNAKGIAKFLSSANPNLPEDALINMLSAHGGHHVAQIDELSTGDFAGEARTWTAMRQHMQVLADTLAAALVKQFPDKF
ncbi:hypothetical protein SA496_10025 [Pseudomonas sp. JS3066]|uniref:hypothetical protein n=1 Tax=unclassified Pseudomonas TaxID=196821 RepID=UPI000EA91A76|nr:MULTISPECIES: hypothetical protein [unclassified Pseudomonas]AYF87021.1 hypothetical protein D6Z43_07580 [Pseudomonas sp. DY-1]WVK95476.1 hypothetical protein SA496_10025 [Pseudomonas sp. JS3066]